MPTPELSRPVRTVCPLDCWDACGVLAHVQPEGPTAGKIKLEGDPDHPISQGRLCARTYAYPERAASPERITVPHLRRDGVLEPASWEVALSQLEDRLDRLRREGRTRSVLHVQSAGSMGVLKRLSARFWNLYGGVTEAEGDFCLGAGKDAMTNQLGDYRAHDWDDVERSRLVILWGRDPLVSGPHRLRFLQAAQANGARIVSINPLRIGRTKLIDEHVVIRPGSDGFLAQAMARVLFDEGRVDRAFLDASAERADRFENLVRGRSLESCAALCGLEVGAIRRLALAYADRRPAAILLGTGPIRYRHGVSAAAWISTLPALTGQYGIPGGGLSYSVRHLRGTDDPRLSSPRSDVANRELSAALWHHRIHDLDPKIEMLWVNGANPAAMLPDSSAMATALAAIPFKVVVDLHWSDTALAADCVLPHPSFLEEDGLVTSWGTHYVAWQRAVVPPTGEARTDLQIFQELATRLGFGEEMAGTPADWSRRWMGTRLDDREWSELLDGPGVVKSREHEPIPWEGGRFATESGKYRFPEREVDESHVPRGDAEYPFLLLTPKNRARHLSQQTPSSEPDRVAGTMASDVARSLALAPTASAHRVVLRSRIGAIPASLVEDADLAPSLVVVPLAGVVWKQTAVNLLTAPLCAEDGVTAAYYDCPIRVELETDDRARR
mgnify:CR=1 FL=1